MKHSLRNDIENRKNHISQAKLVDLIEANGITKTILYGKGVMSSIL